MMKTFRIITLLGIVGTALFFSPNNSPAHASSVVLEPVIFNSYYINNYMYSNGSNPTSRLYALGASDANYENTTLHVDNIQCMQGEYITYTVIQFGSPKSSSIYNWSGNSISYGNSAGQVAQVAKAYADGWYSNSFNCFYLRLIIGVNNSYICGTQSASQPCDSNSGNGLASSVNAANQDLSGENEAWQIKVMGGLDAETSAQDSFGSYQAAYDYASGYNNFLFNNSLAWNLYDDGDAAPSYDYDWGGNGSTFNNHIYTLAWGLGYDEPMPEAYSTGENAQWASVASATTGGNQGAMQFAPVLLDAACSVDYDNSMWQDFVNRNSTYIPSGSSAASYQEPVSYPSLPSQPENWCPLPAYLAP